DNCGNFSTCAQTITVQDTTAPIISCPANITVECSDDSSPANTGSATATDNCDATPTITFSDASTQTSNGSCNDQNYTITRTWKATDNCGNFSACPQLITVHDTTAPVITCPADKTIECSDSSAPANTGSATATDNCDTTPTITFSDVSTQTADGSCNDQNYTITRTWKATDNCGNFSTCPQLITVHDTTAPVITCPADQTIECSDASAPANTGSATATDNCDTTPTITFSDVSTQTTDGSCNDQNYTITRT